MCELNHHTKPTNGQILHSESDNDDNADINDDDNTKTNTEMNRFDQKILLGCEYLRHTLS